jgi:hypothetical protein
MIQKELTLSQSNQRESTILWTVQRDNLLNQIRMVAQVLMMHRKTLVRSLAQILSVLRDKQKLLKVLDPASTALRRQLHLSSQTNLSQVFQKPKVVHYQGLILMEGLGPTNRKIS